MQFLGPVTLELELLGILGLIVSIGGFAIAYWQIRRTRSAAESAELAAGEAREGVSFITSISDLSQIISLMEQVKELHRNEEWSRANDRYTPLRQLLTSAKSRLPDETGSAFTHAIIQLREMEKESNNALNGDSSISSAAFNNILVDLQQSLDEVRVELEGYLTR